MIEISDACKRGDHKQCDGMIYRKNANGMMEVIGPCQCGCHSIRTNLKGKDVEGIIKTAKDEEIRLLENLENKFRKFAEVRE
ncbi:MAG: hypothetical protein ACP5RE_03815 [Candidatus Acidifodinimicrobium sp.]